MSFRSCLLLLTLLCMRVGRQIRTLSLTTRSSLEYYLFVLLRSSLLTADALLHARRPANMDTIDDSSQLIGVPAGTCTAQPAQPAANYYFVTVRPGSAAVAASAARPRLPFEGLRLGAQLGKGECSNQSCTCRKGIIMFWPPVS